MEPSVDMPKQVQAVYDQIVKAYASRNHDNMPEKPIALAQKLIQHTQGAHILDASCGTGRDMARFESQGVAVTRIDLSYRMLAYACQSVRSRLLMMHMRNLAFTLCQARGCLVLCFIATPTQE